MANVEQLKNMIYFAVFIIVVGLIVYIFPTFLSPVYSGLFGAMSNLPAVNALSAPANAVTTGTVSVIGLYLVYMILFGTIVTIFVDCYYAYKYPSKEHGAMNIGMIFLAIALWAALNFGLLSVFTGFNIQNLLGYKLFTSGYYITVVCFGLAVAAVLNYNK